MNIGRITRSFAAGVLGAVVLTSLHEVLRRTVPRAPRMDVLGMRGIARVARGLGADPPDHLHEAALLADIASNAAYYSLVGAIPGRAAAAGAILGLAAGAGAVLLPGPIGLGSAPGARTPATQVLTAALYTAGGLAAGACYEAMKNE